MKASDHGIDDAYRRDLGGRGHTLDDDGANDYGKRQRRQRNQ